jgi:hypothetical protein
MKNIRSTGATLAYQQFSNGGSGYLKNVCTKESWES